MAVYVEFESEGSQAAANLSNDEARALAQFLKRVGIDDFKDLSADIVEARQMQAALILLRAALNCVGYDPR